MARYDIPEALIAFGIIGCLVWAIYNWRHRDTRHPTNRYNRTT
jgi:hypothetical protein